MPITFEQLYASQRQYRLIAEAPARLLCFDPGETTGVALFHGAKWLSSAQCNTGDVEIALMNLTKLFTKIQPTEVVFEDYRVYANRTDQHAGSSLLTTRLIGMIETLCYQHNVPYHKNMAAMVKQFCTDHRLKQWGMYDRKNRHGRDATRHGCYHIIFRPKTLFSQQIVHETRTHRVG
jgi:hypothetical protein